MEKSIFKNKRGNIFDIAFIIVMGFSVMFSILLYFQQWDNITTDLIATSELNNVTKQQIQMHQNNTSVAWDRMLVLIFFTAFFSIMASAFFIESNMAFFFIGVIITSIFTYIAAILSNAYQEILLGDSALATYIQSDFTLSNHIINNFPKYSAILGVLVLICLYAKIVRAPVQ